MVVGVCPVAAGCARPQTWPRQFQSGTTAFTVYQPQVESWQWRTLAGRVAVSVKDAASPQEQFGVVWFTAQTNVNRAGNLVTLDDITLTKANFPASPDKADQYLQALRSVAPAQMADLSFGHLQAELSVTQAESTPQKPVEVKNDVPTIYFSTGPAMLVQVDGPAELRQVQGYSNMMRVINTYAVLLFDQSQGLFYLHAVGRWMQATGLEAQWSCCRSASGQPEQDSEYPHQGRTGQRARPARRVRRAVGRERHLPEDLCQYRAGGAHHDSGEPLLRADRRPVDPRRDQHRRQHHRRHGHRPSLRAHFGALVRHAIDGDGAVAVRAERQASGGVRHRFL